MRILGARSLAIRNVYFRLRYAPLLGRWARSLARHMYAPGAKVWATVPTGLGAGLVILVDPRLELNYLRGDHEPWIQGLIRQTIAPGGIFCDVGAHVGFFSLCAARLAGERGKVWAIEPDPDNYARLRVNADRNQLSGTVRTVPAACWSQSGRLKFSRAISGSTPGKVVAAQHDSTKTDWAEVSAVTLDGLLPDPPDLVKIDVEGGEVHVLHGAASLVTLRRSVWAVEVHGSSQEDEVVHILTAAGYAVSVQEQRHPAYHDYRQRYVLAHP